MRKAGCKASGSNLQMSGYSKWKHEFGINMIGLPGKTYNSQQPIYVHVTLLRLPRSGWSVGRAGLGAKATYPV